MGALNVPLLKGGCRECKFQLAGSAEKGCWNKPAESIMDAQGSLRREHEAELGALERILARDAGADTPQPAAGPYVCALTMEIFREPVSTPCGLSYERAALMEHLAKVGRLLELA